MKQIDLDDLPPRIAQTLAALAQGEELVLAQGGAVVARLVVADPVAPPAPSPTETLLTEIRDLLKERAA